MSLALQGARIVTPEGVVDDGWVEVADGHIVALGAGSPPAPAASVIDLGGRWLVPGFIDIHVHGGGGGSFQSADPEDITRATDFHLAHGTTTMLGSLVSAPLPQLLDAITALSEIAGAGPLVGIHLEGPFLSPVRRGAHDRHALVAPTRERLGRLVRAARDRLSMVTLAPELDGGVAAVRQLADTGVLVAVGHTDASYETTRDAISAGARVATHLFNGMAPLHHRDPGPVLALMEDERVSLELINDGIHLHDSLVRNVVVGAGADRCVLVTDAIPGAGLPEGTHKLGDQNIVVGQGRAMLGDGSSLAGSVLTMAESVRRAVELGIPVPAAIASATTTPARLLGLSDDRGAVRPGARADLVVLDQKLSVERVMRGGEWRRAAGP